MNAEHLSTAQSECSPPFCIMRQYVAAFKCGMERKIKIKIGAIKLLIFMEIKGSARFGGKHAVRPKEHGRGGKFPEIPTSAFP